MDESMYNCCDHHYKNFNVYYKTLAKTSLFINVIF